MNDQKAIKKIFSLARYDFVNNVSQFILMTGILSVVGYIFFSMVCWIESNFKIMNWNWFFAMSPDILAHIYVQDDRTSSVIMYAIRWGWFGFKSIMLPLVIIKNCLDLAFDSQLSGFVIQPSRAFIGSQILAGFSFGWFLLINSLYGLFFLVLTCGYSGLLLFLALHHEYAGYLTYAWVLTMGFSFLYAQVYNLLLMHIVEYKKGFWQSYQDISALVSGNLFFIFKIILLQAMMTMSTLAAFYYLSEPVINFFVKVITWFLQLLDLSVGATFLIMISNFFCVWAYILLYAWITLVTAHLYRYLICPPVDNPSCLSCTGCNK